MSEKKCETCKWAEHLSKSGKLPGYVGYDYNCRYDPKYTSVYGNHWCSHWESKTVGITDCDKPYTVQFVNCKVYAPESMKSGIGFSNDEGKTLHIETDGTFPYPPKCPSQRLYIKHTDECKSGRAVWEEHMKRFDEILYKDAVNRLGFGCKVYHGSKLFVLGEKRIIVECNKIGQGLGE